MGYSRDTMEELHKMKREVGDNAKASAEDWHRTSRDKFHSIASEIKTLLTDCHKALASDEAEIENALPGRVATTVATALVAGVVIGYLLRRRP